MRHTLLVIALAAVVAGCGSAHGTAELVGMPAGEAICRLAKEGLSYRMGSGPVVKPSVAIACRPVDGPQPKIVRVQRVQRLVALRATCDPAIGCS